ncbi:ADAMTS-like protein 3 isoform X1 [Arapaima gigas]
MWLLLQAGSSESQDPSQSAYFVPEFSLSPQGSFQEDATEERLLTYRHDDQSSRITRSDEDREVGWDAWGTWSDCSRTCGGGASYSLRRCLSGSCEGRNIRYRTCSIVDCPVDSGDFRAQQCSAHNDVKYQGHTYEWIPATHDVAAPCSLRCQAQGQGLVVELAPKVLDGTRCRAGSLDMCINGVCEEVGCDHQLGSNAKEDSCGVCAGDGSTCRLVRGQVLSHVSPEESVKTVVEIPLGSRSMRVTAKGPDLLIVETHSLQGQREEYIPGSPGAHIMGNTSVELQKGPDRLTLRAPGPLVADFIVKVKDTAPRNTLVQFMFYQPIRYQWRETDFFPCTATCGGGYQLNSAECRDMRLNRAVAEYHCNLYPENKKPKPKLRECSLDLCPESDGFKEVMPYDQFQPLPRWEMNPWMTCSASCGGGTQSRSVVCVEEDLQGQVTQVEEWKCTHSSRPADHQDCNTFDCPQWAAMEWSQCTVTCGRGLRYRVVLCLDHRGQHAGGCDTGRKPHVKEDCLVPVACYRPQETVPVEAKPPWQKLAQELEEPRAASEEPMFLTGPWLPCSATCGSGWQKRRVKCRILLTFTQTEVDLPDEECREERPLAERPCQLRSCIGISGPHHSEQHYGWEHVGFTACSSTCAAGTQETMVRCLTKETHKIVDESFCSRFRRPPAAIRVCNPHPCPPRWESGPWTQCTATCGVGIQTRSVHCRQLRSLRPVDTVAVPDFKCRELKPPVLRACNQVDCPAAWHLEEWQQCSHTCGGGTQSRKVHCKQQLSTGGFLKLPDTSCPGNKPAAYKPCARTPCPPQMVGGDWSECSVSCGSGIQRREPVCRRLTTAGQQVTLPRAACEGLPLPLLVRTCRMNACSKLKKVERPRQPYILGLHRIYIQTRQEKRIHLTVGGRAYLFPKTSLVIKCPVRHFQKHNIKWEKDGQALFSSRHLGITKSGSLKIHMLEVADVGVYRCTAGMASETFILKLIGSKNWQVMLPEGKGFEVRPEGITANQDLGYLDEMWKHMSTMWQNWSQKNEFYLDDSQAQGHEEAFLQVLHSYLTSTAQPPDNHLGSSILPGVHSLEPLELVELLKKINFTSEKKSGNKAKETTSWHIQQMTPSPQKQPMSGGEAKSSSVLLDRTANSSEQRPEERKAQHKKPVIVWQEQYPLAGFQENISMTIGQRAILTNDTRSVLLLCIAHGAPDPNITWTKDGKQVHVTDRVFWDSTGVLHISNPRKEDQGVYCCTATNELGSDAHTSELLMAEPPSIAASRRDTSDVKNMVLSAVVGGRVAVRRGVNLTLLCPVSGFPLPNVTWGRAEAPLTRNAVPQADGSLLLHNASDRDIGTYACSASNALGTSVASSRIRVIDPTTRGHLVHRNVSQGMVLMASPLGTNITVRPGDILRIGCPFHPNPREPVSWSFQNRTLQRVPGLRYRVLAGGRVLELNLLSGKSVGRYKCQTTFFSELLSAWVHVNVEAFDWRPGVWTGCSASCGNRGSQYRRVRCTSAGGQEVAPVLCHHRPRPASPFQLCNMWDCPPSWETTIWSECSASCEWGFRQRQVRCHQWQAQGTLRVLPDSMCATVPRPVDREDCLSHLCTVWQTIRWGQCSGRCVGPALAIQSRPVMCQHTNGSALAESHCAQRTRPSSVRNCTWEVCANQWRTGPWRACSTDCGSGFQSRQVECVHRRTGRKLANQQCAWQHRPVTWQHCNVASCDGVCRDTTHYCITVKRLQLCPLAHYRQRCCQTCHEESLVSPS